MNVWSTNVVERSKVLVLGVSPVIVFPPMAPSKSPGCGFPTADFGTNMVIVPSVLKLASGTPTFVSLRTRTAGMPASASVPYSKVTALFWSLVIPI